MSWLPRLQQRLSITKNEALTLLSLSLFLLVGTAGRYMCRQMQPVSAEYYAEIDSLFAARSAAARAAAEEANSTARTSGRGADQAVGRASRSPGRAAAPQPSGARSPAEESATSYHQGPSNSDNSNTSQPDPRETDAATRDGSPSFVIDINEATAEELDRLPRVGPKIAERIIEFRRTYGRFQSVDELMSVRGIGATTLEQIRPHARVDAPSAAEARADEATAPDSLVTDSTL